MDIEQLRKLCTAKPFMMTRHAEARRRQRGISVPAIKNAIMTGEIIEDYPDAYPHPACLILSLKQADRPLHVVCGVADDTLWVITVYQPDVSQWESDFRTRKGDQ